MSTHPEPVNAGVRAAISGSPLVRTCRLPAGRALTIAATTVAILDDHLVGTERAGVDLDRVVGAPQRGRRAGRIALVAGDDLGARRLLRRPACRPPRSSATRRRARSSAWRSGRTSPPRRGRRPCRCRAPRPPRRRRAPMRRCSPSSAARTSGSAETRDAPSEISGRADRRGRRPAPFSEHAVHASLEPKGRVEPSASAATPGPSSQATPRSRARSAIDPVDRARIEQRVPEPLRQQARRGRFSGPGGPVDRDDQAVARGQP